MRCACMAKLSERTCGCRARGPHAWHDVHPCEHHVCPCVSPCWAVCGTDGHAAITSSSATVHTVCMQQASIRLYLVVHKVVVAEVDEPELVADLLRDTYGPRPASCIMPSVTGQRTAYLDVEDVQERVVGRELGKLRQVNHLNSRCSAPGSRLLATSNATQCKPGSLPKSHRSSQWWWITAPGGNC